MPRKTETAPDTIAEVVRELQPADKAAHAESGLIRMTKGDHALAVHPSCVEQHEEQGWTKVGS